MCSIIADSEQHRFIIGSCSIPPSDDSLEQKQNELHLLSYSEDANRIDVDKVYKMPKQAEVTQVSSSPYNRNIIALGLSTFDFPDPSEEAKSASRL